MSKVEDLEFLADAIVADIVRMELSGMDYNDKSSEIIYKAKFEEAVQNTQSLVKEEIELNLKAAKGFFNKVVCCFRMLFIAKRVYKELPAFILDAYEIATSKASAMSEKELRDCSKRLLTFEGALRAIIQQRFTGVER